MALNENLISVLSHVAEYLNQNELIDLASTCREIYDKIAIPKLYRRIVINEEPVMRTNLWYLESYATFVSGYRSVIKSADQNDIFVYDRIERLLHSGKLELIRELIITDKVFADEDSGFRLFKILIERLVAIDKLEVLQIMDIRLSQIFYELYLELTHLKKIHLFDFEDRVQVKSFANCNSLRLMLQNHTSSNSKVISSESLEFVTHIKELIVEDVESHTLLFFQNLFEANIQFPNVNSLKFEHVHTYTSSELTTVHINKVIALEKLEKLEMSIACEVPGCHCIDDFLFDLSTNLKSLNKLSLIENTFQTQGDHYTEENWDISIAKFILNIPNVSKNLKLLNIDHNPPKNGEQSNSVDGNYFRRRDLYSKVLPELTALQTLIAPSILLSLSSYDILIGDLLWNGCKCPFCNKILPILDEYIMNHQVFDNEYSDYKDISVTNFFAYVQQILSKRIKHQIVWDTDIQNIPPTNKTWDFHGFESISHFDDYDCTFDNRVFNAVPIAVAHFFNGYMDNLVVFMPNLSVAILSGIYYSVDKSTRKYKNIYDE
ncbi:hypothetical protein Kpol_480p20 [Vanderwaltozyma polyspora DSM 70294]|uniref:F-box domain-containing protein n=1 Tax=Vanderwaltozyma polyspora (strain ATCC 22028 / DSM 70294 / BCRC 21397 / CBS 2163 / NBRC 10782 / NRRL Y-8283 / UCD 57-17) TaxID=436907 RepID=A7TP82_VANPO|nr:uncharacterized protein Kpol_480p20 [Vanderwaltozyma polyspora DSM 70294]EDO15933.1 hypothetical protein Kpol_480p20 [Vanderwaltozyma polyspora DSM 70294]